jgi:peptidyl-prolyl cis-trans isomerase B (cyclophilin B)
MPRTPRTLTIAAVSLAVLVSACSTDGTVETASSTTPSTTATTVPLEVVPANYVQYLHQPVACGAEQPPPATEMKFDQPEDLGITGPVTVTLNTSCGPIEIALDPAAAPETVNSFVFLAEQGYFDGTVSHRILPGFMMQAGDPTATGRGGPGYTIPDEFPATPDYRRGVVAMANAGSGTGGSQFFIMFGDAAWLAPTYTIFGEVVSGFDTLDAIAAVPLGRGPSSADAQPSTPLESVFIESVTVNR